MGKPRVCPADAEEHETEAVNQKGNHAQVAGFRPVHGKQKGINDAETDAGKHTAQQLGECLGRG